MRINSIDEALHDEIREIVADIVEVDVELVGWKTHFWDELHADTLQGIEILSALERRFRITIDQSSLAVMDNVESTYNVVIAARAAAESHG